MLPPPPIPTRGPGDLGLPMPMSYAPCNDLLPLGQDRFRIVFSWADLHAAHEVEESGICYPRSTRPAFIGFMPQGSGWASAMPLFGAAAGSRSVTVTSNAAFLASIGSAWAAAGSRHLKKHRPSASAI